MFWARSDIKEDHKYGPKYQRSVFGMSKRPLGSVEGAAPKKKGPGRGLGDRSDEDAAKSCTVARDAKGKWAQMSHRLIPMIMAVLDSPMYTAELRVKHSDNWCHIMGHPKKGQREFLLLYILWSELHGVIDDVRLENDGKEWQIRSFRVVAAKHTQFVTEFEAFVKEVDRASQGEEAPSPPADGGIPADPGASGAPADGGIPADPGASGAPADAGIPADPGASGTPADGGIPADPGASGAPADAGIPADPGASGAPADAGIPADPGASGAPADAGIPADPGASGAPADAEMPSDPGAVHEHGDENMDFKGIKKLLQRMNIRPVGDKKTSIIMAPWKKAFGGANQHCFCRRSADELTQ